ncbi:hypothetical protein L3Y19_gp116 [Gordonia phage Neville]|uniref:Uncharacterized protein n=1 Tax=Gordonia phage Neville TaxID=2301693 RepID=A0A385DYG2_9CAUD|nr:hypothetical protein L3Y19_gp116 [Gordonia phage Neville]AXQ64471.1 hypothetical protein SEA_NEVILLE_114 [Gordonia phage Neville]
MKETREHLVQKIRDGWGGGTYHLPARGGLIQVPEVRDGGTTAALIDYAVDVSLQELTRD